MPSRTRKTESRRRSRAPVPDSRTYQLVVRWSERDRCFLAEAPALRGCRTHGDSAEEALRHGQEAVALWLEEAIAHGDHIPPPVGDYSGKLTLRLPPSLHQRIALSAERNHVSVNQWILTRLAEQEG
jgi:antitoxin HicB